MKKIVIIFHESEIIRKGLASVLRNILNIEIIQADAVNDFEAFKDISDSQIVLLIDSNLQNHNELYFQLKKKNIVHLITVLMSDREKKSTDSSLKYHITLKTPASEIHELVSKILKIYSKTLSSKEGDDLTEREKEVLKSVALGHSNKEIAEKLFISIHTVISHRKNITAKLGIKSISGLTIYAFLSKIIDNELNDINNLI